MNDSFYSTQHIFLHAIFFCILYHHMSSAGPRDDYLEKTIFCISGMVALYASVYVPSFFPYS